MTAAVQEILTGELRCILCGRSAATAQVRNDRTRVTLAQPHYAEDVRRLRCPVCAGNLQITDTKYERVLHFYLRPQDLVPRRGRPPKVGVR